MREDAAITFVIHKECEDYVRGLGFRMQIDAIPSSIDYVKDPEELHPLGIYLSALEEDMVEYYIEKWKDPNNRPDIVISDMFALAATDLAEIFDIQQIVFFPNVFGYQFAADSTFMTEYNAFSTVFDVLPASDNTFVRAFRYLLRNASYFVINRLLTEGRNQVRAKYGLNPVKNLNGSGLDKPYLAFIEGFYDYVEPRLLPPYIHLTGPIRLQVPRPSNDQSLTNWIHQSNNFIYVAFGTLIDFTPEQIEVFHSLLSTSPYQFLIVSKVFTSDLKNVKVVEFTNQKEVLGSSKVLAFVSHGGSASTTEATDNGVPIICLPHGKDQFYACDRVQATGIGKMIKPSELSSESLGLALEEVIGKRGYKEALKRAKLIMSTYGGEKRIAELVMIYAQIGYEHLETRWYHLPWYKKNEMDIFIVYGVILVGLVKGVMYCCCKCRRKVKTD